MWSASRALVRSLPRQVRSYGGKSTSDYVPPHMNELPVPQGSWADLNNARQRKYNITLAAGISFAAFTIFVTKQSGLVFFNFNPPDSID